MALRLTTLVASILILASCGSNDGSANKLAREGRGLLPRPTAATGTLAGSAPKQAFLYQFLEEESPDLLSRTLFETEEPGNFKVSVREFSLPPRSGPETITLPKAAVLELRTDHGDLRIGG